MSGVGSSASWQSVETEDCSAACSKSFLARVQAPASHLQESQAEFPNTADSESPLQHTWHDQTSSPRQTPDCLESLMVVSVRVDAAKAAWPVKTLQAIRDCSGIGSCRLLGNPGAVGLVAGLNWMALAS